MSYRCVLIACFVLPSSGCSVIIARSGTDLNTITTQSQVRETFGEPITKNSTDDDDGDNYEDYRTRRKIQDSMLADTSGLGFAMFLGTSEFFMFPIVVGTTTQRAVFGQDLRFTYDENGNVISWKWNDWEHKLIPLEYDGGERSKSDRSSSKSSIVESSEI